MASSNVRVVSGQARSVTLHTSVREAGPFSAFLMFSLLLRRIPLRQFPVGLQARRYVSPTELSEGEKKIYNKLTEKFSPTDLTVQDVSGKHGATA